MPNKFLVGPRFIGRCTGQVGEECDDCGGGYTPVSTVRRCGRLHVLVVDNLTPQSFRHVDVDPFFAHSLDRRHQLDDVDVVEETAPQRQRTARYLHFQQNMSFSHCFTMTGVYKILGKCCYHLKM